MPKGRPRKYAKQSAEGPGKRLFVPDVDWGGVFLDHELVEPPGGSAKGGAARISDSSRAAPEPRQRATITSLQVEREKRIGPDRDARQAETEERIRRLVEENPKYPAREKGYN